MSAHADTWYELWPDSHQPNDAELERYREKSEAREAAQRMRARQTGLQYIDIMEVQIVGGERSAPRPIDSI